MRCYSDIERLAQFQGSAAITDLQATKLWCHPDLGYRCKTRGAVVPLKIWGMVHPLDLVILGCWTEPTGYRNASREETWPRKLARALLYSRWVRSMNLIVTEKVKYGFES